MLAPLLAVIVCLTPPPTTQRTSPYDVLDRSWAPYLSKDDPSAFAMKIRAVSASPRALWGGGKELFFIWCRSNCADWLAQRDRYSICHGDVHFGNMGVYASNEGFGRLGVGLVDFDESSPMPSEIDLLQACISLRLMSQMFGLTEDQQLVLCQDLLTGYQRGAKSDGRAIDLLADDPLVKTLLKAGTQHTYQQALDLVTDGNGKFRRVIMKQDAIREILRPAMDRADELSAAIAEALHRSPELVNCLRPMDASEVRRSIKDIALRTRIGSAGSQGLEKIFVLLDRPFLGEDHDGILYLKQEVVPAPQRAGMTPKDPRSPGQRVAEAAATLCDPEPLVNGWCDAGGRSYWMTLLEVWSGELEDVRPEGFDDIKSLARIGGMILGTAHRSAAASNVDAAILNRLSGEYYAVLVEQYEALRGDPRTLERIQEAEAFIESMKR